MAYKDKEKEKAYRKAYYLANKDKIKSRSKKQYHIHKDEIKSKYKDYRKTHKEEFKAYNKADTNLFGQTKQSIRAKSSRYLFNTLKHKRLVGYEIHHCFGYEDHRNFIYIPKELHLKIHQFLRDNCIDADTDHYNQIAQLIINYIKCNEKHILILKQSQ